MKQDKFDHPAVIALVDISLYKIENGTLKVLDKENSGMEIPHSVLKSIKRLYPDAEVIGNVSDNKEGVTIYKIENVSASESGEFIDINSAV